MKADPRHEKEDIQVSVSDTTLTITGEKKQEEHVEKKEYVHFERSYGSFARVFHLPAEVQTGKVKAVFRDGVLEVRMPNQYRTEARKVLVE